MITRISPRFLVASVALATVVGCNNKPPEQNAEQEEEQLEPAIQVELPAPPDFDEGKVAEQWEDGSYSLYGLRKHLDDRVKEGGEGKEIMVKGFVQDIYVPPECPEGEICPPPKQPHVWITDKEDAKGKKRAMMVVNYRVQMTEREAREWKKEPEVVLEKGKRYTFKGKFKQFSDSGFASDQGLLEFIAYKPHDPASGQELDTWVYPPGAAWHPIEIAKQEEANARLAERASKTAIQPPQAPPQE